MVILEGESLLNDATALLIYRAAVLAALGAWTGWSGAPGLGLAVAGSVLLGCALGRLWPVVSRHITDIPTSVVTQFVTTFAVWIVAERLMLSPVITLVCYAMTLARRTGGSVMDGPRRIQSYAVWDVAVFVLNVLAFILAGLQLRPILAGVHSMATPGAFGFAGAVLGTAVLVRIVWVMGYNTVARWKHRRSAAPPPWPVTPPTVATGLLNAWCGMRGVVTLATALALPEGFPFRDLILLSAFGVVLGTLVIQGLTLRPLMLLLKLSDSGEVEKEVRLARQRVAQVALGVLNAADGPDRALRDEQAALLRHARHGPSPEDAALLLARRQLLEAQRQALVQLRAARDIGDDAFHVVEEELDAFEFYSERRLARLVG
jgi:CPA1 family monovalent cation:H+ antiporter